MTEVVLPSVHPSRVIALTVSGFTPSESGAVSEKGAGAPVPARVVDEPPGSTDTVTSPGDCAVPVTVTVSFRVSIPAVGAVSTSSNGEPDTHVPAPSHASSPLQESPSGHVVPAGAGSCAARFEDWSHASSSLAPTSLNVEW